MPCKGRLAFTGDLGLLCLVLRHAVNAKRSIAVSYFTPTSAVSVRAGSYRINLSEYICFSRKRRDEPKPEKC
ncbi:unnamed protein product [Litomosoides sigmodontis]|uniref:Secreted protein n=1 Tax=Litomosoides sigmodontis TaxID=42156 RepID=A0A3P6SHY7_LITSI|nr:unnamed protein product [Litomosoides sigmodontis]